MFFQTLSPPQKPVKAKVEKKEVVEEDITVLSLAPFTHNPKVCFDDVHVGATATRKLHIRNPTKFDIELYITKGPPDEREVCYTWVQELVPSESSVFLELTWSPKQAGSWRDVITLEDGNRIKKDIPVIFKCIVPKLQKKMNKPRKSIKAISAKIKPSTIARKSPTKKPMPTFKTSPLKRRFSPPQSRISPVKALKEKPQDNSPQKLQHFALLSSAKTSKESPAKIQKEYYLSKQSPPKTQKEHYLLPVEKTPRVQRRSPARVRSPVEELMEKTEFLERMLGERMDISERKPREKLNFPERLGEQREFPGNILRENRLSQIENAILMEKLYMQKLSPVIEPPERRQTFRVDNKENLPNSTFTLEQRLFSPQLEVFEDSLEKLDETQATPLHSTVNQGRSFCFSPDCNVMIKIDKMMLTPINDNFNPSTCSTGEKSGMNATYDCELKHNSSRATYVIGDVSTKSWSEEVNDCGGTFVKSHDSSANYLKPIDANTSGGTYVKTDANSPSGTYVKPSEGVGNYYLQDLEDSVDCDFNNHTSALQSARCLEKIMEESYQGSECEESYLLKSNRKRKSVNGLVGGGAVLSPKRGNFCEINVTPVKRRNVKSGLNLQDFIAKQRALKAKAESIILHNPDEHLKNLQDPYLLATTGNVDPFLSVTSYYEPRWLDEQEIRFKKWLNLILTPPKDLQSNPDAQINIAKIWQECKKNEVEKEKALTKEEISNKEAVRGALDKLRASAVALFKTREVSQVLSKLAVIVESGKLVIRADKNVHLDLGLQQEIMALFLCYNPLWLRVGLETVFGRTLRLHSNSDIMGISFFIMSNFFKDAYLLKKHKHARDERYQLEIKKLILKKFLMLIYFLDVAKEKRLVQYDPCLFCKNAPFKESKEVLFKFTSVLLSAIGDITKCLKQIGYVLTHKQTYIHEFDYAVNSLGADLRDGVRLTRVMEVILLRENLIQLMRVPAISRLQKIHNVKVAFNALQAADYKIQQDIQPKDIVDGHREKTLSLLWQIIYKFEAPLVKKSIITIQHWWNSLLITLKRRVLKRQHQKRVCAAVKIQAYYRGWKLMHLQRNAYLEQRALQKCVSAAIKIQSHYRSWKLTQLQRRAYLDLIKSARCLQVWFRSKLQMLKMRRLFIEKRNCVLVIQRRFRARKAGLQQRKCFLSQKQAAVVIQRRFRATLLMHRARAAYINCRESAIKIQLFYKARQAMGVERRRFLLMKKSVVGIEIWWTSLQLMQKQRAEYREFREAALAMQARFRAVIKMRAQRSAFTQLKEAAILIQRLYRAKTCMRIVRQDYVNKRLAIVEIQRRFRAYQLKLTARRAFLLCRSSAVLIQKFYRGYLKMKQARLAFCSLKKTVLYVEEKRCAQLRGRAAHRSYLQLRRSAVFIQNKFRANCAYKSQRVNYLRMRLAVVRIQVWYKGLFMVREAQEDFKRKKQATMVIQRFFRSWLEVRKQVEILRRKLAAIKGLQRCGRGLLARRVFRELTDPEAVLKRRMNKAAIVIQATWRGYRVRILESNEMRTIRNRFEAVSNELNTQKCIGYRKDEALKVLANVNSSYLQIVCALEHLEYITRRHKALCQTLSEILPEVIANMIINSGRSDPDKFACILGADILINFIKYPPSYKNAWVPDHIKGIVTTMTHWCDKESNAFPLLCTVIWLYTHNKTYLRHIKATPNLKQHCVKMLRLCERKQKMVSVARRNPSGNVLFAHYTGLPVPSLEPDWGLGLKTKPRAFTNSLHAIRSLISVLELN